MNEGCTKAVAYFLWFVLSTGGALWFGHGAGLTWQQSAWVLGGAWAGSIATMLAGVAMLIIAKGIR